MNYQRINNYTGWGVFAIALISYLLTVAPTASFWDCGEFIACSNELEVTHPPGAPLFLLLGRIMSMLTFGNTSSVAFMINLLSVFASAFTALFTCWTTTMLARKGLRDMEISDKSKLIATMAAGVVAGLTCTYADSIWFNAVEAEVYALSSFFTAIVVWLIFKWETHADEPDHLRWIILITYLMGLSIGVHLLNLLTIPALALVYYFRKFDFSWKGLLLTLGISGVSLVVILYGIIQYTFSFAWSLEKLFTGTITRAGANQGGLGLPMGTGSFILGLVVIATVVGLTIYSQKNRKQILNTVLLGYMVIMVGFSSYSVIFIRSNVDPPIDMNNPENILTFLSYMRREQYGDRPLFRGPLYNGQVDRDANGYAKTKLKGMKYTLLDGEDKYVEDTKDVEYIYRSNDLVFFPRMYDPNRYNSGPFGYRNFVKRKGDIKDIRDDKPTAMEDFTFFLEYQLNHMYLRYFLWNFVGRESDLQEARWESGFEFWDDSRFTPNKKDNKGKNHYFYLPLLFGLLGLVWHSMNQKSDAAIIGLLFLSTGLAIVLYLNQYPLQPRERDYSYAGSFQTFCIWIGLGVIFFVDLLRKSFKDLTPWIAGGFCLLAPLLMAVQNWDDHTRKGRYVDIEFAKNLLNSCAENAILFTGGDNDTFPLWYIQEVEGFRTDVRVVNLELLISDWYIDQMKQQKNESPALPISMEKKDYAGEKDLVIQPYASREIILPVDKEKLINDNVLTEAEASLTGSVISWDFKARSGGRYILRKDSVMIDIMRNVANSGWDRPVYFANTMPSSNFLNLQKYFRLEGLAFRVVPVPRSENTPNDIYYGWIGQDIMLNNLIEKFEYSGLNNVHVNFDEHIRNVIIGNYRNSFFRLMNSYTEQFVKLASENQTLKGLQFGNPALTDSIQQVIDQNRIQQVAIQNNVQTAFNFAEEKIPHRVTPKNTTLLITQAQMLDRVGLAELSKEEYKRVEVATLEELTSDMKVGVKIDQNNMSLRGALMAVQYYVQQDMVEDAQFLANEIKLITGNPLGETIIQKGKVDPSSN